MKNNTDQRLSEMFNNPKPPVTFTPPPPPISFLPIQGPGGQGLGTPCVRVVVASSKKLRWGLKEKQYDTLNYRS